ncbi:hypothetical protein HYH02_014265 [Chlamydomonas schloesseri]|uniref:Uncharacterized protein n=1 Tax=Chlamydomonas schloesseri TaxID=2026947 RepID=A0A835SSH4_9CHLO|nr:hypothetical protein HYH02_014265 [Chlamydomonas schloesseri]|eukprot:KAG2428853.1 hypothetical protein HYH02_014265 [Chlamydomonas schloesseri]
MSTTTVVPPQPAAAAAAMPQPQLQTRTSAKPPGVNVPAAELRRLTAAICELRDGGEGGGVLDTALATARAYDRYHPYRVSNRKDWKEGADAAHAADASAAATATAAATTTAAHGHAAPHTTHSATAGGSHEREPAAGAATAVLQPYHHMRTYGVHLRQGVMLALTPPGDTHSEAGRWTAAQAAAAAAAGGGGDEVAAAPVVRLVHIFRLSRPLLSPAALAGAEPLPTAAAIEMEDCHRPVDDLRFLAPRLLGATLPADLAPLMLGTSSGSSSYWPLVPGDREAAAAASYAFAAWLGRLPPPETPGGGTGGGAAGQAEAGDKEKKGKVEAAGGGGLAGAVWRALGGLRTWFGSAERQVVREEEEEAKAGAKHGPPGPHATTIAAAPAGPAATAAATTTSTSSTGGVGAGVGAPRPPPTTPAEAWAEFEARVRTRAPGEGATETERQWLRALGMLE